jgi:anti-sigma regulatory factor (Ser/Thr protein kinase)
MDFVRRARFAPRPEAVAEARAFVRSALAAWHYDDDDGDVAVLLTSELVTNAVRHARTDCTVEVRLLGEELQVAVEDSCPTMPAQDSVGASSLTGRGLLLVDAMARRWGADVVKGGKVVWFALRLPGGMRGSPSPA